MAVALALPLVDSARGAGRHAARVLGDALAVLRDREAERRPHGLQVVVACAELVRACCAAEATVAVAMATDLFREICALAADETPRGAPRPARARLAAALMALAGAAPVREESAARAALRRFRQKRAAARAFAGDVHIRALLDELAGGADEQAREKRQRVQAARAGLHRALAEDASSVPVARACMHPPTEHCLLRVASACERSQARRHSYRSPRPLNVAQARRRPGATRARGLEPADALRPFFVSKQDIIHRDGGTSRMGRL